jgi:hypothetical protein
MGCDKKIESVGRAPAYKTSPSTETSSSTSMAATMKVRLGILPTCESYSTICVDQWAMFFVRNVQSLLDGHSFWMKVEPTGLV